MSTTDQAPALFGWGEAEPALVLPPQLKTLTASKASCFLRCPEQFRRRYIQKLEGPRPLALLWGAADHRAHEVNLKQKIHTHRDLPLDAVLDAWREGVRLEVEDSRAGVDWGNFSEAEVIDRGIGLVTAYHEQVSPWIQPTAVESWFRLTPEWSPIPLTGKLDVVTADRIIDRKTESKLTTSIKPDRLLQARLYHLAGGVPVEFHSISRANARICTGAALTVSPSVQEIQVFQRALVGILWQVGAYWRKYGPDEPWDGNGLNHPWACGMCDARVTCEWWRGTGDNPPIV